MSRANTRTSRHTWNSLSAAEGKGRQANHNRHGTGQICSPFIHCSVVGTTMRLSTAAALILLSASATQASLFSSAPKTFGRFHTPGWSVASAIRGGSTGTIKHSSAIS
jgi:hypothetical protein